MLITVIIPTYNRAHFIKEAIDSVLNQSYQNFELLIIDDHSKDNTKEVIKSIEDPRVKYLLNNRSKGAQGARNTGLYSANGDWVALLDSDDVWLPTKLEKQVDYIKNPDNNLVGLSTGNAKYDFKKNKIILYKIPGKKRYTIDDLLYKNYLSGFSTFIFNKNIALESGGFDERFPAMQDLDFYIAMCKRGEVHCLPDVLAYTRTNSDDRITTNYKLKLAASDMFHIKYGSIIKSSIYLKNKATSRRLVYGWKQNKIKNIKYIHCLLLSLFIDRSNLKWVVSNIIRQ